VNRCNSLDQETVDVGSINSFKGRLDKIKKGWFFMDPVWSAMPLASWRSDPHEATQGELQGELPCILFTCLTLAGERNMITLAVVICYGLHIAFYQSTK